MTTLLTDADPNATHPLLVTTTWLQDHLAEPGLVLIDAGEALAYRRAHIPGAVGLPHPYLKAEDAPLFVMDAAAVQSIVRRLGVSATSTVVLYDDNASLHAARAWWVFERYGLTGARILDGGFNAWLDEGRPLTSAAPHPAPGDFQVRSDDALSIDADELIDVVATGGTQIWDTRADDEWQGTNTRGNARTGHVPGAIHLEWRHLVQGPPARRFRPVEEIRQHLIDAGLDPARQTVTYCQSGVRAAFGAFVLRLLGDAPVRVYDGSMNDWTGRADTPLVLESPAS